MIFDVPRINTTVRDSIVATNSTVIYNTDNNRYEYYNGTLWKHFGEGEVLTFNTRTGNVSLLDSDIASLGDFTISGTVTINNDIVFGPQTLKLMTSSVDPNVSGVSGGVGSIILKNDGTIWQKLDIDDKDWSRIQTGYFTGEPTGFPIDNSGQIDRSSSVISFNEGNRNFSIAPSGTNYSILIKGREYLKTSTEVKEISNIEGIHYLYFDVNGELQELTTFSSDLILKDVLIATVYWDTTNNKAILFGDERHGCTMDSHTHARIHSESGAVYISGMALNNFTVDGDGSSEAHLTFSANSGTFRDEDILHSLSSKSTADLMPVLYRDGLNWRSITPTISGGTFARAIGSSGTPGQIAYNQFSGGTWTRTSVSNGNFVCYHLMATNDVNNPYMIIMGTNEYTSKSDAQTGAITEISTLSGLPFIEVVFVGTILFECRTGYTNSLKAAILSVNSANYVDWRFRSTLNPSTASVNSHNSLGGIYGTSPYYHSDQPISTVDNVTFKSLAATDKISLSNQIIYTTTGALTSSAITTDYSIIKFNPNATTFIHGIGNPSNGKIIILQNISSSIDITINHQSTTEATASNRIITVLGTNVILKRGTSAILIYSSSDSRWRFVSSGSHNDLSGLNGGNTSTNLYYHSDQPINTQSSVSFSSVRADNIFNIYGLYVYTLSGPTVTSANFAPTSATGISTVHANTTIHGIGWENGTEFQGKLLFIKNTSASESITIANQSTTETSATRRIITGTGSGYILDPNCIVLLFYDGAVARWKIVGQNKHNRFSDIQGGESGNYYHSNQPINTTDNVAFNGLTIASGVAATGIIRFNNITYPNSDGTPNQVLKTDGSGNLSFGTITQDHNLLTNIQGGGGGNYYHSNQPINTTDSVQFSGLTVLGDLTVSGTTTTVNSTTLQIEDKNIELGKVTSPSDILADGGGITLLGDSNKTLTWSNSTDSWTSSEYFDLASGKDYKINGTTVLSSSQVLGKSVPTGDIVGTSDTQSLSNKTLDGFTLNGDINSTAYATDFDLLDNVTSALSFDTAGKSGILEIDTVDGSEKVKMSGGLDVTGTSNLKNITATGTLILNGITFPTSDGSPNQVLKTDGSGNLSFGTITQDHNLLTNIQGGDGTNYYHSNQPINTTDNVIFNSLSVSELTASGTSNLSNVVIAGNLTVNGTTSTVNSTITILEDPIIELGKTSPVLDDNKDRGISFNYHDGVSAKVGYFGYQDSTGNFIFIPDASITNEIVSGTKGTIDANINWTNINNIPDYLLKTGGVISGNLNVSGVTTLNEIKFDAEINNSVSGTINNTNTNSKSTIIFSPSGLLTVTGFDSGVSGNGKILYIINKGSADITLVNDSALSQSQNRIITGTGTDFTIKAGAGTVLQFYDGWRLLGGAAGGSSSINEEIISINSGSSININSNGSIFETYEDGHYEFMSTSDPTLSFELFIKNGSPPDATIITSSNLVFDNDEAGYLCAFISGNNLVLKNNLGYLVSLKVIFIGVS